MRGGLQCKINFFVEDGIKKHNGRRYFFASFEIRRCKLLTSCQKIHHPGVNRLDGVILCYMYCIHLILNEIRKEFCDLIGSEAVRTQAYRPAYKPGNA